MNPLRVLHIMPTLVPAYGGPVQALVGLATAQVRAGMSVCVFSPFREGDDLSNAEQLRSDGVDVEVVGPTVGALGWHRHMTPRLEAAISSADVVHIHAVWEQVQHVAARLARRMGKPYIVRPCGMLTTWALHRQSFGKWLKKRVYLALRLRKTLNAATAIHYTTELEREWTAQLGIRAPAIVEPSGFDMTEYETLPPKGGFRSRYEIGERPLVVFLGRIFPGKGLEYLVPAFARVEPKDAMLAIIGPDGGLEREVREMIGGLGIQDRVVFPGMLRGKEKVTALADADLFCLPSDHENFGLVVIEALAAGTPVVVSDQVGIHHQIVEGGVGSAVRRDADALGAEISEWLTHRDRRDVAAERAKAFVQERFTWSRIASRWQQHYHDLLKRPAGIT